MNFTTNSSKVGDTNGKSRTCIRATVRRPLVHTALSLSESGPIVRISPYEVRIDDPEYYNYLFGNEMKLDKDPWVCGQFGNTLSLQATSSHAQHRHRRTALSPFFSQAKVASLQPIIAQKIKKLCELLDKQMATRKPVSMYDLYRFMTVDVITLYSFAESFNFLDHLEEGRKWFQYITDSGPLAALIRHNKWIFPMFSKLGQFMARFGKSKAKSPMRTMDVHHTIPSYKPQKSH